MDVRCGIGFSPLATGRVVLAGGDIIVPVFFSFFLLDQINVG